MNVIHRDIYVTRHQRIQPIEIVRGSQIEIELQLMDYTVPAGASAKAYARGRYTADTYVSNCTVSGHTVSFMQPDGFFIPGPNRLQIEINGVIIPFSIDVNCESRISDAGDPATPEKVTPLVERAETAARKAEDALNSVPQIAVEAAKPFAERAETAASSADRSRKAVESLRTELETNYPEIPALKESINTMAQDFYALGLTVIDSKLCVEVVTE